MLSSLMSQYEYLRLGPKSWVALKAVKAIELNRETANDAQSSVNFDAMCGKFLFDLIFPWF